MPLSGYRIDAEDPVLEEKLWAAFPLRCLRFWPYFLTDAEGLREFLERDLPAQVSTQMDHFGRFETSIKWLTPWLKVEWEGKLWYISKEGRMWDASDDMTPTFSGKIEGPVWRLSRLGETQAPPSGVFQAPVATEGIVEFVDKYRQYDWFKVATEVIVERRAGAELFHLNLKRGGQRFEVLIQSAKYAGQDWGAAIDMILSRLLKEGGDHLIDATYEGKILLRNLGG